MKSFQAFFFVMTSILIILFIYVGFRLRKWSQWKNKKLFAMMTSMLLFILSSFAGIYFLRQFPGQMRDWYYEYYLVFFILGSLVTLILYTSFIDVFYSTKSLIQRLRKPRKASVENVNLNRRKFVSLGAASFTSVAVGNWQAQGNPDIHRVKIKIEGLPKEFNGYKIVQITDLHVGAMIGLDYVQKVVACANSLGADLVALTGDISDGPLAAIETDLKGLHELKAKDGILYVTGNHEYYWGIEDSLKIYAEMGFKVLLNQHIVIRRDLSEIVIAGVTDFDSVKHLATHASDPTKALLGSPANAVKILLAHQPKSYAAALAANYDLQISGHTHGGQFFPWSLIVALAQPYYRGLYQNGKMWIYTSTGTGYWGPPNRFAVPKEIALIELQSADHEMT